MKTTFYIEAIKDLLCELDSGTVEAIYRVLSSIAERRKKPDGLLQKNNRSLRASQGQ